MLIFFLIVQKCIKNQWALIISVKKKKKKKKKRHQATVEYDGVSKSFQTSRLEQELQMVQHSATKCNCIAIL
jgi:hypothetical protein